VTAGQDWTTRNFCPPKNKAFGPQDQDVYNPPGSTEKLKDWFIGQTTYVAPGPPKRDVIVQEWCINTGGNHAGDFFTLRVLTSFGNGPEVVTLPAGIKFCPFDGGQNSGPTTPAGKLIGNLPVGDLSTLPNRIDWVSNDPTSGAKNLASKTIVWIIPGQIKEKTSEGAVAAGKIIVKAGAVNPDPKEVPAGAFPPNVKGLPPNLYLPPGAKTPIPASKLTPEQELWLYKQAVVEYLRNKKNYEHTPRSEAKADLGNVPAAVSQPGFLPTATTG
jgi:hypothetical protein